MKKALLLILPVFIFLPALLYLHQKVQLYVEAYQLSRNYRYYNELVDKRDYLMYNFSKEVSLDKVNQWARAEDFIPIGKEKIFARNTQQQLSPSRSKIALLFKRFLKASTSAPAALAREKR